MSFATVSELQAYVEDLKEVSDSAEKADEIASNERPAPFMTRLFS